MMGRPKIDQQVVFLGVRDLEATADFYEGVLELRIGDEKHILEAGDSIYFDSDIPHAARGLDPGKSKAIVVVTT